MVVTVRGLSQDSTGYAEISLVELKLANSVQRNLLLRQQSSLRAGSPIRNALEV